MAYLLGLKLDMSQVFDPETGKVSPVTLVSLKSCRVVNIKSLDNGKTKIWIGLSSAKHPKKPMKGIIKGTSVPRYFISVDNFNDSLKVGDPIDSSLLTKGSMLTICSVSKGKGFQGVFRRYNFRGMGGRTHGASNKERAIGSIGSGTTLGRVFKNQKMAGRMGGNRKTISGVKLVDIVSNDLIALKGSIPGARNSLVIINDASK